jgi:predicted aldo/keto reductase-like oxidoreductase
MSSYSRRDFLKTSLAAGAMASTVAAAAPTALHAATSVTTRTALDKVTLGRSNVKATRLAFGSGTNNGYVQASLGQKEFNRLVAHAYERGVRFYETAESYMTPAMLGEALKPYPRESYVVMHKVTTNDGDPARRFDAMLKTFQTDYFDIMLLHWQTTSDWPTKSKKWQDGIEEFQSQKKIIARGASCHGLPAFSQVPGNKWLQVSLVRINHNGSRMDGDTYMDSNNPDHRDEVVAHIQQIKKEDMGVIGMKLIGGGQFENSRADRQAAMRFAVQTAGVDCVTVGCKTTQEIDETIDNLNLALA